MSAVQFSPFEPYTIKEASASSTWTETTRVDFQNGTLDYLKIDGNGTTAEIRLANASQYNWSKMTLTAKPSPRYKHAMATIYNTDKVLLYGGRYNTKTFADTWIYDLNDNKWTKKITSNSPSKRKNHAMASINGTDKVLFFGGMDGNSWTTNDTWVYNLSNNKWTKMLPAKSPIDRCAHSMAPIYGTDKVLLFGGWRSGTGVMNDTWVYDVSKNNWTKMFPQNKPPTRSDFGMAPIFGTDKILTFGPDDKTYIYDFSENNWTNMMPPNKPPARERPAVVPINIINKVILFGGSHSRKNTWIYNLSENNWTKLNFHIMPEPRYGPVMALVNGTTSIVLFGGYKTNGDTDETWILKQNTNKYEKSGTFISDRYNFSVNASLLNISWNVSTPVNTSIKLQIKTGADESELVNNSFVGPDGTKSTYYTTLPATVWIGHHGAKWIQYKIYFTSNNNNGTPKLKDISLNYNCLPETKSLLPYNGYCTIDNTPLFSWNFTDLDSSQQSAFQVIIAKDVTFKNINYDSGEQISINRSWQFPDDTIYSKITDGIWYWKIRLKDNDNDWGFYSAPNTLIIDTKKPTSQIIMPEDNNWYNEIISIYGTASDHVGGSGIDKVEINIKRINDNYYWDGSNWISTKKWLLTVGTTNWSHDTSTVTWTNNTQYFVISRALDNASNLETPGTGNNFCFDLTKPLSTISHPLNNTNFNKLYEISGTAVDTASSGIGYVRISIKRKIDDYYWNGSGWSIFETWLETAGTEEWIYNSNEIPWITNYQYIISVYAVDIATNVELFKHGNCFKFDNERPYSYIVTPINNSNLASIDTITGYSNDINGSGLNTTEISITNINDNKSWNGLDWEIDKTWLPTEGSQFWLYDAGNVFWYSDTRYIIQSRSIDKAGNYGIPEYGITFMFDNNTPINLSISINNGDLFTNSKDVTLFLTAEDFGTGVSHMSFSINGLEWSKWERFSTKKLFDLSGSDGKKIIYFRVKDIVENIAIPVSDSIELDTKRPKISIIIENGTEYINYQLVELQLNATDSGSGPYEMSFSFEKIIWSEWEKFKLKKIITLPPGNDEKTVFFKVQDRAGNIAFSVFDTITLDTIPPGWLNITINENDEFTNSNNISLTLNGVDYISGISKMAFSMDNISWTDWESFQRITYQNLPIGDGKKIVFFKAQDLAGNIAQPVFNSIILDTNPPKNISFLLNNGAKYTNSTLLDLTITAYDSLSGLGQMMFYDDRITWTGWVPFNNVDSLTITEINGEKKIYLKVMDNAGNIAEPIFDKIILDTNPPYLLSIQVDNVAIESNSFLISLKLNATDELSNVSNMSFSIDDGIWSTWEKYNNTKLFVISIDYNVIKISFNAKDSNGNIAEPVSTIINLYQYKQDNNSSSENEKQTNDQFKITLLILTILSILVIIIVSVYIFSFIHHKKHKTISKNVQPIDQLKPPQKKTVPSGGDVCFTCGHQLFFVESQNRSYCFRCKKYD